MPLSLAEHARRGRRHRSDRSLRPGGRDAGARARAAQSALPARRRHGAAVSRPASFDLVLSHAVIEHVADAPLYLRECRRVLDARRPLLSVDGAVSVVRRRASAAAARAGAAASDRRPRRSRSGRSDCWPVTRRGRCKEPAHENSFIRDARNGIVKHDDLLEKVRVRRLRDQIAAAGLRVVREELHVTGTVRRLPARARPLAARQSAHAGRADQ